MESNEVQLNCQQVYFNNLKYLDEKHQHIFKKIALLEVAIEQKLYKERYSLEYTNNTFNIKNIENNIFLYDKDLNSDAINRIRQITLDDKKAFKSFQNIDIPKHYVINEDITKTHLQTLYPLIEHTQKYSGKEFKLQKLEKFVFFGCLLGKHIELFIKTHKPKIILINEQDLEIFKLSLFVTDYSKLGESTQIIFSITNDKDAFMQDVNIFLSLFDLYNYIIKFDILNDDYLPMIDIFLNTLSLTRHTNFPFSANLMTIDRTKDLYKNGYSFLDFSKVYQILKNTNVIIVSPGPSLQENIQWLYEQKDKFLIVAFGATLKTLYKNNIQPDIITSVDPTMDIMDQFNGIEPSFYKNSILFTSSNSPTALFDIFDKEKTYIYQVIYNLFPIGSFGGKSIGDLTFGLLLRLGAENIYLLGTDLCIDEQTGSAHVKEHQHYKELEEIKQHNKFEDGYITDQDLIEIDGNFKEKVLTTRHFLGVINTYQMHIKNLATDTTNIYNLSNGAKINKTIPATINDINISETIDKNKIIDQILSETIYHNPKIQYLNFKIDTLKKTINLLNNYKDNVYNDYNSMMYDKFTVTIDALTILKDEMGAQIGLDLLRSFNDNVEGYINTFFNNKINQKKQKRFNTLFKYWIKPQITIFEKYKELLEEFKNIQKKPK